MIFQGLPVCVEEVRAQRLFPDELVPIPRKIGTDKLCGKRHIRMECDRPAALGYPFELCPQRFKWDDRIPGVPGGAIRQIRQHHVHAIIRDAFQHFQAIAVVQLHGAASFLLALWCRLQGSNLHTSGYEPDALAD